MENDVDFLYDWNNKLQEDNARLEKENKILREKLYMLQNELENTKSFSISILSAFDHHIIEEDKFKLEIQKYSNELTNLSSLQNNVDHKSSKRKREEKQLKEEIKEIINTQDEEKEKDEKEEKLSKQRRVPPKKNF